MNRKVQEKMIVRNGKMQYAVSLLSAIENERAKKESSTHVYIEGGRLKFADSSWYGASEYNFNDEAHRIAKDIFISQLRTDVRVRIMELKQLEEVLTSLDMPELLEDEIPKTTNGIWGNIKRLVTGD